MRGAPVHRQADEPRDQPVGRGSHERRRSEGIPWQASHAPQCAIDANPRGIGEAAGFV